MWMLYSLVGHYRYKGKSRTDTVMSTTISREIGDWEGEVLALEVLIIQQEELMNGARKGGRCGIFTVFMTIIKKATLFPYLCPLNL